VLILLFPLDPEKDTVDVSSSPTATDRVNPSGSSFGLHTAVTFNLQAAIAIAASVGEYIQTWKLKFSTTKTVSVVFHLK